MSSSHRVGSLGALSLVLTGLACTGNPANRIRIEVTSSLDQSRQPSNLFLPPALDSTQPVPLAVLLHTWSFDLDQRHETVERESARRGWLLLEPNFRGRNDHPEACGSALAQQDVLDAVAWVRAHYRVDSTRIYVLGLSGGGHMTLLMAGRAPELWAAASAWVGIGDLARYHQDHATDGDGKMTRQCLGGPPGSSAAVDAEYRLRSPNTRLGLAAAIPIEIAAGRRDGEVAFSQSIRAFNVLAAAHGVGPVGEDEIAQLEGDGPGLARPSVEDTATDSTFKRRIHLRRWAGPSRLTIFEGGHEWIPELAIGWLADKRRP
ncbi:MAG: alpha/beta hydrolase family protein [Gemmatimonadales bacterium]